MNKLTMKFSALLAVILLIIGGNESAARTTSPTPAATATSRDVTFPVLTGPYKVGRTEFEWVDHSRAETFASIPGLKRDLMAYVWFPASVTKRTKIAPYMDSGLMWDDSALGQAQPVGLGLVAHPGLNDLVHTHAYSTSTLDTSQPSYPILIFVHGLLPGLGPDALNYVSILEDLASHGYIVIATSHPYSDDVIRYPDGRLVTAGSVGQALDTTNPALLTIWTQDVRLVLDQVEILNATDQDFKGHLDLTRIGVFGHTFGGETSMEVTGTDPRVKAGAALEAGGVVVASAIPDPGNKPFLYTGFGDMNIGSAQSSQDKYLLTIDGMSQQNYSDFGLLVSLIPELNGRIDTIDPARGIQIVNSYLLAYFDHYLKGAVLNWPTYPEAHLQTLGAATPAG
ncbi:MAG: alpha/beta hydrolase family protein [Aggregatilineales bacterium]